MGQAKIPIIDQVAGNLINLINRKGCELIKCLINYMVNLNN